MNKTYKTVWKTKKKSKPKNKFKAKTANYWKKIKNCLVKRKELDYTKHFSKWIPVFKKGMNNGKHKFEDLFAKTIQSVKD